ncbi:WXG100 family type VII secretion target [Allokutzneria oryzae]|uniref:WXG100 family type VII secretion target n=1 Tax=Allokutzneria oryzae TaxID=1378989 RepID=A0ABV6A8R1_9PSEU
MAEYTVTFGRVQGVLSEMAAIDSQIKSMLAKLEQDAQHNLAQWNSDAQLAYRDCKAKWDHSARQMPVLLAQARTALGDIMAGYTGAEKAGTEMFGGTGVGR